MKLGLGIRGISAVIGLVAPLGVFAAPSLDGAKCGFSVQAPENGAGVLFSKECNVAYVLPPVRGRAEVSAVARNLNLQFCNAVGKVGEVADSTISSMASISKQLKQLSARYEPMLEEADQIGQRLAIARAERTAALELQQLTGKRRDQAMSELEVQLTGLKSCQLTATDASACSEFAEGVKAARAKVREIEYELSKADLKLSHATRKRDREQELLDATQERYTRSVEPILKLQSRLTELNQNVMDLYKEYAPLEGATAQIEYAIEWDELVESYRKSNPALALRWERIPVRTGELWASVKSSSQLVEIPAVIRSSIPGMRSAGLDGIEESTGPVVGGQTNFSPPASIDFSNSVSGQIVLSLVGACPYFSGPNARRDGIDFSELAAHMVANTTYTYEVGATRGYTASYNMNQFYKRVETKRKKGGFFSSKTIHSIVEDGNSTDWFKIEFDSPTSGEFQYSEAEQAEISREVKADLIDRALQRLAFLAGGSATPPGLPTASPTGASAAAKALSRCPNWYCQAGSLGLGVLNSIFGRSTAVASFERHNDIWTKDTVRGTKVLVRSATTTFSPAKN